jgi:Spy/CpxP family protein refolding chaperone
MLGARVPDFNGFGGKHLFRLTAVRETQNSEDAPNPKFQPVALALPYPVTFFLQHSYKEHMKTSKLLVLTMAAGLAAGGFCIFQAHAAEPTVGQGRFRGQFLERAKEKLGLTDEQVAKIRTELRGEKDTLHDLISKLHEARVDLRNAIQASDATEASVRAASAKVAEVEANLAVARLKVYGKISPILTPEQREQVKQFQSHIDEFLDNAINRAAEKLSAE